MKIGTIIRRFLIPGFVVSGIYALRHGCLVSPRAEVEMSGNLTIGKKTQIGSFTKIKASDGPLEIGANTFIGSSCFISSHRAGVRIGDFAMISSHVSIINNDYEYDDLETPICKQPQTSKGIDIGDNVWIGAGAVIMDGSTIGAGSIISPNSVVTGRIPDNSVVQGIPGKVIFERR